jgi:hypothetical protein
MSAPGQSSLDPKALLQELKTNRKTQIALGIMVLILAYSAYTLFSDSPKPTRKGSPRVLATSGTNERQIQALQKLPNLAQLGLAGELPGEDRMYRDIFTYDMPAPPPVKVKPTPPLPPPPPKTPEQIKAEQEQAAKNQELNTKPQNLRYLGYMGTKTSGRLADFVKGDEPVTMRVGDMATPSWKLITITETYAEFQNTKYMDLRHRCEASENKGHSPNAPSNEF